ncbi:MAG: hypothetical protein Q8K73_07420 [Anaerolineales bacterium]|nr:hypothetical protein [Anaerolineales bacterium]
MPNLSININTRRIFYCKLFSKFIPARILVCFFRKMPAEQLSFMGEQKIRCICLESVQAKHVRQVAPCAILGASFTLQTPPGTAAGA